MSIPGFYLLRNCLTHFFSPTALEIMQETKTFGACEWEKLGLSINAPPIPEKIQNYLDLQCPFWPNQRIRETHFLFLVPDQVTLEKLYGLAGSKSNSPFLKKATDFAASPYWVLITKQAIPGTRDLNFEQQEKLVSEYGYKIPTVLEAAMAVVAAKFSGFIIFPSPGLFTRCKTENGDYWPVAIGHDGVTPFSITLNDCNIVNGTAGVYIPEN